MRLAVNQITALRTKSILRALQKEHEKEIFSYVAIIQVASTFTLIFFDNIDLTFSWMIVYSITKYFLTFFWLIKNAVYIKPSLVIDCGKRQKQFEIK